MPEIRRKKFMLGLRFHRSSSASACHHHRRAMWALRQRIASRRIVQRLREAGAKVIYRGLTQRVDSWPAIQTRPPRSRMEKRQQAPITWRKPAAHARPWLKNPDGASAAASAGAQAIRQTCATYSNGAKPHRDGTASRAGAQAVADGGVVLPSVPARRCHGRARRLASCRSLLSAPARSTADGDHLASEYISPRRYS